MINILFISTLNLASNPRLVKEVRLAIASGYSVSVVCFTFENWSKKINEALLSELKGVQWILLSGNQRPFLPWLASVLEEKICRIFAKTGTRNKRILASAISRRNRLLLFALSRVHRADLVVGHNPGAIYATFRAAQYFNCRSGFDVEDYHPGEGQNMNMHAFSRRLMKECLPSMNYVSFAAPLILQAVRNDLEKENPNWLTVQNYFPEREFIVPNQTFGPLKLVWFSQHIAFGRGLEHILPLLPAFEREIEFHLYGELDPVFYNVYLKDLENVKVNLPVTQKELHHNLSYYDVGLALELPVDVNRDLCITNKLLAYCQAGLYVWATPTSAQVEFFNHNIGLGITSNVLDRTEVEKTLIKLVEQKVVDSHQINN
ncbi:MAG: hypothetical protein EOO07_27695, partial [Chitinophagaceae bacterium]